MKCAASGRSVPLLETAHRRTKNGAPGEGARHSMGSMRCPYRWASISALSLGLGTAPTERMISEPPLSMTTVGMDMTP